MLDSLGHGNINYRLLLRWDFSDWGGRTVTAAQLRLFIIDKPSQREMYTIETCQVYPGPEFSATGRNLAKNASGWQGSTVHRTSQTGWTTASTYQGLSWSDGSDIGTEYGTLGNGLDLVYIDLNADAITAINAAIGGTGDPGGSGSALNLTLGSFAAGWYSRNVRIASTRHVNANYRPALVLTYTS